MLGIKKPFSSPHTSQQVFKIENYAELRAALDDLSKEDSVQLVFRGQTRVYESLRPTAFRSGVVRLTEAEEFMDGFLRVTLPRWCGEFYGGRHPYSYVSRDFYGLLQHYGFPTEYLDVTYDPEIALWFATHDFVPSGDYRGKYVLADRDPGIVYVFAPQSHLSHLEQCSGISAVSLCETAISLNWYSPMRIIKQNAALLAGATSIQPDLLHHVTAVLDIRKSIRMDDEWHHFLKRHPVRKVFPPVSGLVNDYFYYFLLVNKSAVNGKITLLENDYMIKSLSNYSQFKEKT